MDAMGLPSHGLIEANEEQRHRADACERDDSLRTHASSALHLRGVKTRHGYNILAIPLAAGVLAAWGILLSPAVGAVLMSASTVIVAVSAQLLKRADL